MRFTYIIILLCGALHGQMLFAEEGSAAQAAQDGVVQIAPEAAGAQDELLLGREIFLRKCMSCHRGGRNGAPIRDRPADWSKRLEQSTDTLIRHAIEGHQGQRGTMPPRGKLALSDAEVAAAVRYVVGNARQLVAQSRLPPVCESQPCQIDAAEFMLMQLLWILSHGAQVSR